ncbi:MAG TPA: hypothetical protein DHV57_19565 [Hyphomonas sp.]|jgi:hypothetical protein|uniref:hypothetical protein n=1 Tax=Hyphomonas sp. UBA5107 TaxID=1946636 RepID=UPI000C44FC45|nr:hypothetical protein [Hyphomonas sp. UBA5107]MAA93785.1 hypothetical protein [Rheinheimera sp.]MAN65040.1 hypothetical protein [Hyphomonadaceae bacterium]MBG66592.1 hypothetical protein [Hyphomonas sp.]HBL94455.1 hypothetical protein [Hyphomonas sp.]HCJ19609.1 hypothetical protein [Hyphomonas sp.]|tara:strand:- start:1244 stop:2026 length:783 start_codon:yes stop_codon:yes gene_type:complete
MNDFVAFQMWKPFRQRLIKSHTFYFEQARQRLLSRFENIDTEAEQEMDDWLIETSHLFDPDRDDPADSYEAASEVGIEFYELLTEMRDRTRLSVIAGMFHEWDKQLRDWLCSEIMRWHSGEILRQRVWSVDFTKIMDLLEAFGWEIRKTTYHQNLDGCRVLVNVYKHGDGKSFQDLRAYYPRYIEVPCSDPAHLEWSRGLADYTNLKVTVQDIEAISDAIVTFWESVPENVYVSQVINLPSWFEVALHKDNELRNRETSA